MTPAVQHRPGFPCWVRVTAGLLRAAGLGLFMIWLLVRAAALVLEPITDRLLQDVRRSPRFYAWLTVLGVVVGLGGYALVASLFFSMEILEFSVKVPWAAMVSSYTWLVVTGSGLCIINALGGVFGMHRYEMMARRIVFLSMTSILFGLMYILMHLGRPERVMIYNLVSPNFRSAISWMGALYNVYLGVVVLEFWLLMRRDWLSYGRQGRGLKSRLCRLIAMERIDRTPIGPVVTSPRFPRIVAAVALMTGVAALTMLGSVFAHTEARALWYGPYYPVYFLLSSLFCGYALLLAMTLLTYRLRGEIMPEGLQRLMAEMAGVLAFLLVLGLLLTGYRLTSTLLDPARKAAALLLVSGPLSVAFWGFEVFCMSVVPVVVLLFSAKEQSMGGILWGAVLVLIGAFVMRYNFVVGGQLYPNISGKLPSYMPTFMEMLVIAGVFAGFLVAYSVGDRVFRLKEAY